MSDPGSASTEGFRAAADAFCDWAAEEEPLTIDDLWRCRELLVLLLFHVKAIENHEHCADTEGQRIDDQEFARAVKRFSGLPFNYYRTVFDPHDFESEDEPVTGMLADDLADIYRDLAEGLDQARRGHLEAACFDWSESYRTHWSRHLLGALGAIENFRVDGGYRIAEG